MIKSRSPFGDEYFLFLLLYCRGEARAKLGETVACTACHLYFYMIFILHKGLKLGCLAQIGLSDCIPGLCYGGKRHKWVYKVDQILMQPILTLLPEE